MDDIFQNQKAVCKEDQIGHNYCVTRTLSTMTKQKIQQKFSSLSKAVLAVVALLGIVFNQTLTTLAAPALPQNPQAGSVAVEAKLPGNAPATAAVITSPGNGASFNKLPVTVNGTCAAGLLVRVYKNEVFAGSTICSATGTFSIQADLFSGANQLVARVYDALDQAGPDSNTVLVTYNDNSGAGLTGARISITSNYAKRGADPGADLRWPFVLSGGTGPYKVSIDWGDGTTQEVSTANVGEVLGSHKYAKSGVYNVVIKAVDANGVASFLQVVAIGNGPLASATTDANGNVVSAPTAVNNFIYKNRYVVWPFYVLIPVMFVTFWLGRKHQLHIVKRKIQRGDEIFRR
jgi:hypothetical protein